MAVNSVQPNTNTIFSAVNNTSNDIVYSSLNLTVPANNSLILTIASFVNMASVQNVLDDIQNGNLSLSDGVGTYSFETAIKLLKNYTNGAWVQRDSDGAPLSRIKQAPTGWTYQLRMVELITASLQAGVFNSDPNLNSLNDATVTCYDSNGTVITDSSLLSGCVKTVMDLEPPYDYYIIGGKVKMTTAPATDVRVSVIGVPDISANLGGSKIFVQNVNFKFIGTTDEISADGRASKALTYSSQLHTNKLRFIINHSAGSQLLIGFFLEIYKQ